MHIKYAYPIANQIRIQFVPSVCGINLSVYDV